MDESDVCDRSNRSSLHELDRLSSFSSSQFCKTILVNRWVNSKIINITQIVFRTWLPTSQRLFIAILTRLTITILNTGDKQTVTVKSVKCQIYFNQTKTNTANSNHPYFLIMAWSNKIALLRIPTECILSKRLESKILTIIRYIFLPLQNCLLQKLHFRFF
jgi:hypothetical protein